MTQTYGLEIESFGLTEGELMNAINSVSNVNYAGHHTYGSRSRISDTTDEGDNQWISENDSSLRGLTGPHGQGHEVISPILSGVNGMKEAKKIMRALLRAGARVNRKCGLHVTMGCQNSRWARMSSAKKSRVLHKIGEAYNYFLAGFESMLPMSRRDGQNIYTGRPRIGTMTFNNIESNADYGRLAFGRGHVNIGKFWRAGIIEFRAHNGTLNGHKIETWALLHHQLMAWAVNTNHPNYAADLRNYTPDIQGLLECLNVGSDLVTRCMNRASEVAQNHRMPESQYWRDYSRHQLMARDEVREIEEDNRLEVRSIMAVA